MMWFKGDGMVWLKGDGHIGWRPVAGVLAVSVALLASAVALGLRWPAGWLGFGPADRGHAFGPGPGRHLVGLDDSYVGRVLGLGEPAGPASPGSGPTGHSITGRTAASRSRGRVEVVHPFTNDAFEHAYPVPSVPFHAQTSMASATRQAGEPIDCLPAGGTAWYRYSAPADEALVADTFGTKGPVGLGVYTGSSLGQLQRVGCDVNPAGNALAPLRAARGTTYWFQITQSKAGLAVFELAPVGRTTVESVGAGGRPADARSIDHPDISADGSIVAFASYATNLTRERPDCGQAVYCTAVFTRDRASGVTRLVATQGTNIAPDDSSNGYVQLFPSVSADGRYVGYSDYQMGPFGSRPSPDGQEVSYALHMFDRRSGAAEPVALTSSGEPMRADPAANGRTAFGTEGFGLASGSFATSPSSDGRYVAFTSDAGNAGAEVDAFHAFNVYLRDRLAGTTRLVSVDGQGHPMRANSYACTGRNASGDGRYVVFESTYGTSTDSNDRLLVYLWDGLTGRTRLVSALPQGNSPEANGSYCPEMSLDGSHLAFVSRDPLVADDTNGTPDIYEYEVASARLTRVSVTSAGAQTTDANYAGSDGTLLARSVSLSADGRYVAFDSTAVDMAPGGSPRPGERSGVTRVFVHDLFTGATTLASVSSSGEPLAGSSSLPYISASGNAVAFMNDGNATARLDVLVHELS